ncbi:MAG: hypothetical protein WCP35_05780 [Verrucomicrobiota bacterium]
MPWSRVWRIEAARQIVAMAGLRMIVLLGWLLALTARGGTGCWVWNRSTPLTAVEERDVQAAGIHTLYWHFAEIENRSGEWTWKSRLARMPQPTTPTLRVVPVIRLEASVAAPFSVVARAALRQRIVAALQPLGADEWQVDYDAPDRLVGGYAEFLAELRGAAPMLSSTALAGWVRLPEFAHLCASVAQLYPMFYDLEPDTAAALQPLLEPDTTAVLLGSWRTHCTIPWKAGLPWFARLTLYGSDGKSRGHLREWSWDEVIFRRELHMLEPPAHGISVFHAEKPCTLGHASLQVGDSLVARWPDPADMAHIEKIAARELVFFRLPDATAAGGGSLREFAHRGGAGAPCLSLTRADGYLVLTNVGDRDLPPRAVGDGPADRGYALEVDATGPVFREAGAGGFFRVLGHRRLDAQTDRKSGVPPVREDTASRLSAHESLGWKPVEQDRQDACLAVPLAAATRLTYWFSALPAGSSLKSGLFQLAPAAASSPLRYRILNSQAHPPWLPLTPVL